MDPYSDYTNLKLQQWVIDQILDDRKLHAAVRRKLIQRNMCEGQTITRWLRINYEKLCMFHNLNALCEVLNVPITTLTEKRK